MITVYVLPQMAAVHLAWRPCLQQSMWAADHDACCMLAVQRRLRNMCQTAGAEVALTYASRSTMKQSSGKQTILGRADSQALQKAQRLLLPATAPRHPSTAAWPVTHLVGPFWTCPPCACLAPWVPSQARLCLPCQRMQVVTVPRQDHRCQHLCGTAQS